MQNQPPPVCNPDGIAWFVRHDDGVVHGPFPFESLVEAARSGRLTAETVVSHPDFTKSNWVHALELPEIAAVIPRHAQAAAPVPPRPVIAAPPRPGWFNWRSSHPGKRILLAAALLWLGGLPLAYAYGVVQAHQGSEYRSDAELYDFDSFVIDRATMTTREQQFSGRSVSIWSGVCGAIAAVGIVVLLTVPDRPWRPDLST